MHGDWTGHQGHKPRSDHNGTWHSSPSLPAVHGAPQQAPRTTAYNPGDGRRQMNCRGLHCPGCHRGGPGGVITALLVLLAVTAGARATARVLPVLLHVLIVTAITAAAAAATIFAAVLVVRRAARPDRRTARQPLGKTSPCAVRAAVGDRRELSLSDAGTAVAASVRRRPGRSAISSITPGQRKDPTAMTGPRRPGPSPAAGTRPPEYLVEAWVSPQLKDRIRHLAATPKDQRQPGLQGEAPQPELEA